MQLERTEARVLGALIEKEYTTPDVYPLTMKALLAACNQKSNRNPVLSLRDFEIEGCLLGLRQKSLARVVDRAGSRTVRYSQHLVEELGISKQEAAMLAELLLRGPQAAGELYRRAKRMARFDGPEQVEALLHDLEQRRFTRLLPRGSGQRHPRWTQLLCTDTGPDDDGADESTTADTSAGSLFPSAAALTGPTPAAQNRSAVSAYARPPESSAPAPSAVPSVPAAAPTAPTSPDPEQSLREQVAALRVELAALRRRVDEIENDTAM